jgi:hypothetical protein
MRKRRRVADAQAEASRAEYQAQVAEAKAKHYSPSKAGTTSQGTNIPAQALTTTPMGAPIPPPTHPAVAEALHQQSLALGIAPDPQGQVPLAPAPPVPALAPPVTTLLAPVGASPGPPGVAEALRQQSLALGIAPDPQGQVPLAPAPLVLAIAALAPPVTALPAPVSATPGPPGVAEVVHQQSPQEQTALAAAGSASTAVAAATTQPVALASPQGAIQPPALGLITAPLQLPEPVVCPAVHQPGEGVDPAGDS